MTVPSPEALNRTRLQLRILLAAVAALGGVVMCFAARSQGSLIGARLGMTTLCDRSDHHDAGGAGFQLCCSGKRLAHRSDPGRLDAKLPRGDTMKTGAEPWTKYAGNPVLGGALGTCFDLCVLREGGGYQMWFSWRPKKSLALTESQDGIHWSEPRIVLGPSGTGWEDEVNRPSIIHRPDGYHLWYTGQAGGHSSIGSASSPDGIHWTRQSRPVLTPDLPWEKVAVMCPDVLWDPKEHQYRMWYSGGDQYEPDAIGYAISPDGIHWTRYGDHPVFRADPASEWEHYKVTACQVVPFHREFYMFYIGFHDMDHAQIGLAKSPDGILNWQRFPGNPIVRPTPGEWDEDAVYKPYTLFDGERWLLWYNGRRGGMEQIGLVTRNGPGLGF